MNLYQYVQDNKNALQKEDLDYLEVYRFSYNETRYKVAFSKELADKRTNICCGNNCVRWEQAIPRGISPIVQSKIICQPSAFMESETICIVVIKGKINSICGLDTDIFASGQFINSQADTHKLYVISEHACKMVLFA